MALSQEQIKLVKEQLFQYLDTLPEEQRKQLKEYIARLDEKQLEEFLIKNKMIKSEEELEAIPESTEKSAPKKTQCIYCSLASKQIESSKIYEDKDYLAILELNPLTKGHTILIPKKHLKETKELKSKAFTTANKLGKHLVKRLEAENFQINTSNELGHAIINLIPLYKNEKITGERKPQTKETLQALAIKIGEMQKKEKTLKIKTDKSESKKENPQEESKKLKEAKKVLSKASIVLPRRIP